MMRTMVDAGRAGWSRPGCLAVAVVLTALAGPQAQAQPSGGPYGPLHVTYEVPVQAAHVYYVAPDGRADAVGTTLEQPTTLEQAIARVVTGDAIVLRGGVYRIGGLLLNQGITMQPYRDEHPVLKGTQVATQWEALREHVWRTSWKHLFPAKPLGWWRRERAGGGPLLLAPVREPVQPQALAFVEQVAGTHEHGGHGSQAGSHGDQ